MSAATPDGTQITDHDLDQIARTNASRRTPVVFVHGLWLLPSSWDRWAAVFEEAGYSALTPGWPDDPATVEEANANPEAFAHKTVGGVADHMEAIIRRLDKKPAIIGHSIGGLLTQILAGRGIASASVAIDPGPFRGVLPLPYQLIRATSPVWSNPANHHRAVPLTYEQFRYGSPTPSARTRRMISTGPSRSRRPGRQSFRPLPRTSIPGPRPRRTPTTPSAARC